MKESIYTLRLHQTMWVESSAVSYWVTRVAGGWIYLYTGAFSNNTTSIFVPFDNEFMSKETTNEDKRGL